MEDCVRTISGVHVCGQSVDSNSVKEVRVCLFAIDILC